MDQSLSVLGIRHCNLIHQVRSGRIGSAQGQAVVETGGCGRPGRNPGDWRWRRAGQRGADLSMNLAEHRRGTKMSVGGCK